MGSRRARPALFIRKAKWEFELHVPVTLEVRHGYRHKRDGLFIRMFCECRTHEFFTDFGKACGC